MIQPTIYIGVDRRHTVDYHVLRHSIERRASKPVRITPLYIYQLPMKRTGLTEFTRTRYMCPWIDATYNNGKHEGWSMFIDADMLCLADIWELFDLEYDTNHSLYVVDAGIRFERQSLMIFNNAKAGPLLTPSKIEHEHPHKLESWAASIGTLPCEWNHCVMYDDPRDGVEGREPAKIVHYTAGTPIHAEIWDCEYRKEWIAEYHDMLTRAPWLSLLGRSVHAEKVLKKMEEQPMLSATDAGLHKILTAP